MVDRRIERQINLPAFRCDLGSFANLVDELSTYCDPGGSAHTVITVSFDREQLKFDSSNELLDYAWPRDSISNVGVLAWPKEHDYPQISFRVGESLTARGRILATSDSEAWNAGATEIALAFVRRHRRWYAGSRIWATLPLGAIVIALLALISRLLELSQPPSFVLWVLASGLLGWAASDAVNWLFPTATIVVREREFFVRRYSPEISIALALAALLVALAAWLFPRM